MSDASSQSGGIVLPKGGGALSGIGEKFSPDLFTGTGNFTVPIALLPGRNGFTPQISLVYSTGHGNGLFGMGWSLGIPGVARKTSAGVPLYNDTEPSLRPGERRDVFILSGAEDLIPVDASKASRIAYQPRTEGLFAQIERVLGPGGDHWLVKSKDGLQSLYGTPRPTGAPPGWTDPAVVRRPNGAAVFAWNLTETRDPFGNRIRYEYSARDTGDAGGHRWDQPLLEHIRYVDYGDPANPEFLVDVVFEYEDGRSDPFSDRRAGFEIRTSKRCRAITVRTRTADGTERSVRTYRLTYENHPANGVSLLRQLDVIGYDDSNKAYDADDPASPFDKQLPPLTFEYTGFDPGKRAFAPVTGSELPARALGAPDMALVDLHGSGLPDIVEINGVVRYWRNLGAGRFDMPRIMRTAPAHSLTSPGVQLIDADGDGRIDLLVTGEPMAGYYPLTREGNWDRARFRRYDAAPTFALDDPEVRLIDLDGDGRTDILRSGSRMECFFNDPDPRVAWKRTNFVPRGTAEVFPDVSFSDPRVKLADMTGDGLEDIVLVHDGGVDYWPNLGHGKWGTRQHMRRSPRLPYGYDPRRLLLGDVDGDGLADFVYIDDGKVSLWLNQSGNAWSEAPVVILGTPPVAQGDHVRLVDLHGTGVGGVLWSSDATGLRRDRMMFLDFTGGVKPYVLHQMDNHMGAETRVEYRSSSADYARDQKSAKTRWRTPLPFPVQVVAKVEVIDAISRGKRTTEYRYHHGYWDGAEREFRGFGMVEQLDTETFDDYHAAGLHRDAGGFVPVPAKHFSPPTCTKSWFHQGPVGDELGDWTEADYSAEYWAQDPPLVGHTTRINDFLRGHIGRDDSSPPPRLRRIKRDALRALRGSSLRTELYAVDGTARQERPYTVTEQAYELREEAEPASPDSTRSRIFFPHLVATRTTQWERGEDPMTQFAFTGKYDLFGHPQQQTAVAMPRLVKRRRALTGAVVGVMQPDEARVLSTHTRTSYATPPPGTYIHDRVAQVKSYEIASPEPGPDDGFDDLQTALRKQWIAAEQVSLRFGVLAPGNVNLIGHQVNHYDGPDFEGLPAGELGAHGALIRTEALVLTDRLLDDAYGARRPDYLGGASTRPGNAPPGFGGDLGYRSSPTPAGGYEAGYYADTQRRRLSPRGMVLGTQDGLKHETSIQYDDHEILPVRVRDSGNLETVADYTYRLLQPQSMTEPNGSRTQLVYSPIGLPLKQFVAGLDAAGNPTLGGTTAEPELAFSYDFRKFERSGTPIFVHTKRRIHHAAESISSDTIESREYSDGYGRLIQSRAQAEEHLFGVAGDDVGLPVARGSATTTATAVAANDRVVVSGFQVFDNKGNVVEKYEPFFSQGWDFQAEHDAKKGEHATMFYDPRGQVIRTVNPDGSQQRVILGRPSTATQLSLTAADLDSGDVPATFEPSPWETYTYDGNDLAPLTHPAAAGVPATHHFTPASVLIDGMGRARCAVVRNGGDPTNEWFVTRSDHDLRGNLLTVTDALGRTAFHYHHDLSNHVVVVDSIDAGRRTSVFDAMGKLVEYRDSKGSLALRTYDGLNRPKDLWARDDTTGAFTLRERIHYGDEGTHALARAHNTLGKPVKHYDEAGLLEMPEYDFKGNLLEKRRRTIRDDVLANDWQADWSASDADAVLEAKVYQTNSRYDALNRPTELTYPEDVGGARKVLTPRYNRAGALDAVKLGADTYVERIAYDAKGQRVLIAYGNGMMTRYAYDRKTFRLARLRTERRAPPGAAPLAFVPAGSVLQDFTYGYDLAGNITHIADDTPSCGIRGAPLGADSLLRAFTYDPIYRLLSATGRACSDIGVPRGLGDDARCGFFAGGPATPNQDNAPDLTEAYTETFEYDPAGNMLVLRYGAASGQWARVFGMGGVAPAQFRTAPNNRLTSLEVGAGSPVHAYRFDDNGNLTRQNEETHHGWDHADRMVEYRVQATPGSPPSLRARYLYGADGMRVKKWVRNQAGTVNTTVYVDGAFEHHRQVDAGTTAENNSLHVMDDRSRVALVRVGPALGARDASPRVQYHFGDHLGSSHVVVGGNDSRANAFVHREEYFPYGETSFGSFGKKRFRHSGKERDEESGLYYYGARYLAPWLVRWVSCDPSGPRDSENLFVYVSNNPLVLVDALGLVASWGCNHLPIAVDRTAIDVNINNHDPQSAIDPKTRRKLDVERTENNLKVTLKGYKEAYSPYITDCGAAALETQHKLTRSPLAGGSATPRLSTFVMPSKKALAGYSSVEFDSTQSAEVLEYVVDKINEGKPLYAGVNVLGTVRVERNEGVTDHILEIVGYRMEKEGDAWLVTQLTMVDNAPGGAEIPERFALFEVLRSKGEILGIIKLGDPSGKQNYTYKREYELTHVRLYAADKRSAQEHHELGLTHAYWEKPPK